MKKLLCVLVSVLMVLSLAACGADVGKEPETTGNEEFSVDAEQIESKDEAEQEDDGSIIDTIEDAVFGSYEDVLAEYSQKLRDATPGLIEEYKEEAESNQDGLTGLASICNDKVSELAKISNDGIQEMAKIYMKKGSGEYSEYEEWAGKIQDVYMEEASKIQDAYMDSALG